MTPDAPPTKGPDPGEKQHVFDNPRNVRLLLRVFFALCALILALDLAVHRHPSFAGDAFTKENWFGFYGFYGFASCVILVLAAVQLRKVLMRPEDYYDD